MTFLIESLREVGHSHIASGDPTQQLIGEALLQVADKAEAKHKHRIWQRRQDVEYLRATYPEQREITATQLMEILREKP